MDFWTIAGFAEFYARTDSTEILEDVLSDAQETIENYVTTTAYDAAKLETGTYYRTFRRVMGQLAIFYLAERPNSGIQQVKSASKSYSGVKSYSESYGNTTFLKDTTGAADILAPLNHWRANTLTAAGALIVNYGTGRFMSAELEFEEDDTIE